MKSWLIKIKSLTHSVRFFWQALIVIFFVTLSLALIVSVMFWLNLNQDFSFSSFDDEVSESNTIDAKKINQVLEQIKIRSVELASTTANSSNLVDPSR